jgi:hypothetical protein
MHSEAKMGGVAGLYLLIQWFRSMVLKGRLGLGAGLAIPNRRSRSSDLVDKGHSMA